MENRLLNDENRHLFMAAFEKFCNLSPDHALNFLWRLAYNVNELSEELSVLGLNLETVPSEQLPTLRSELRYQYESLHPSAFKIDVFEECQEAFQKLINHSDTVVAAVVYNHCREHIYVEDKDRLLYLLNSDKENNFYGGIRSLNFNTNESIYLKSFHTQIHDLLEAMYEVQQAKCAVSPMNTPFANLKDQLEEAGVDFSDVPFTMGDIESPVHKEAESTATAFKELSPDAVLAHKAVFQSFADSNDMNILLEIGGLGFDLNVVISKKQEISNLLLANQRKEEADAMLLQAIEALNK